MLTRRHFLQFTSSALSTIALSQLDSFTQAANLLAQPSPRKYALLVGIDSYDIDPLKGCNTDVDLQRELLIHRYGFTPNDIVELRDRNATYNNIITAFQQHLIHQAQPGDLVVFHFSGHGSRVRDRQAIPELIRNGIGLNGTIVPVDWQTNNPQQVRQIMGKTLFLLSSQLKTNNVVMILDSCHSEGGLRGNSRVRSLDSRMSSGDQLPHVIGAEAELQSRLQTAIGWGDAELQNRRKQGIAKGVAMGAASFDKLADVVNPEALELSQNDFTAGAFTYLFTRYLWQSTGARSLDSVFSQLVLSSILSSNNPDQAPVYKVAPNSGNGRKPIFFTPSALPAAEGVIHLPPKGDQVQFWLGGAAPDCLQAYETAVFNILDRRGNILGEIQQTHRSGLVGYGKLIPSSTLQAPTQLQVGMLLREKVRGIPDHLTLKIGLDASLGEALPIIQQGLLEMAKVAVVPIAEQQELHYIVGRVENLDSPTPRSIAQRSQKGQWCLLTPALEPLPGALGDPNDTVETMLDQLRRRLKTLQAKQLLKTMMGDASTMKISVDLVPAEIVDPKEMTTRPIGPAQTVMSQSAIATNPAAVVVSPKFNRGTIVQVRLRNQEAVPLYMAMMVIFRDGSLSVAYPYAIDAPIDEALVAPTSEKLLKYAFELKFATVFELLVIASRRPLNKLLKAVKEIADQRGEAHRGKPIGLKDDRSIEVATDMLMEIDEISQRAGARPALPERRIVDMNQLGVLSTIVQVKG
ncbi:caspase family protein [Alkalinema sp. FACHB-956]|uniref:caspase family protein n=1 Tax=Alkalinema sp. FACHB-956 TaxID=2692768 RepID=UPI001686BA6A|nr:caspase family protein [Alkalinema sp. FACHB-956]MBD2329104.1 caspase family protein [Alkalinema sp. FACHB-956]